MSHDQGRPASYRELDQRTADGLTVTLEWHPATAALRVVVVTAVTGACFGAAPDCWPSRESSSDADADAPTRDEVVAS